MSAAVVGIASVVGCSSDHDLEARRARQVELTETLENLETDLAQVRKDFETVSGAGAFRRPDPGATPVRKGERSTWIGAQAPHTRLNDADIRVRVERTGLPVALPSLEAPKRGDGPCAWSFTVPRLRPLSDLVLRNSGLGRSSPIVLVENGKPLSSHAEVADISDRCTGSFRHAGAELQFSPRGRSEAVTGREYKLSHAAEVPLPRGDDGRPLYWVYPGTQLEFSVVDRWDPAWGDPTLTLTAKLIGEHTGRPLVELDDVVRTLDGDLPVVEYALRPLQLDGTWSLRISSPIDGPWIVIDTLTLGNDDHAVIISSEHAWSSR